jgi:hypothetical protein
MKDPANVEKSSTAKPPIIAKTNGKSIGLQKPTTDKRGSRLNFVPSASSAFLDDPHLGTSKSSMQVPQEKKRGQPPGNRGKKPGVQ